MPGTDAANLRFLTWNIRHGGGTRRLPEIILSLLGHKPDILVLTEFHARNGGAIRGILADAGLKHQSVSPAPAERNAILLASREPIETTPANTPLSGGPPPGRWLDVRLPELDLFVSGVHIPDDSRRRDKAEYWQFLIHLARQRREAKWVVLGDVNSGRHYLDERGATFTATALLGTFASLGMLDTWRSQRTDSRESSWSIPARSATRIDACYVSTPLHKSLRNSHFSHTERSQGLSDHSALIVELAVRGGITDRVESLENRPETLFGQWRRDEVPCATVQEDTPTNRQKVRKSAELPMVRLEDPREST